MAIVQARTMPRVSDIQVLEIVDTNDEAEEAFVADR